MILNRNSKFHRVWKVLLVAAIVLPLNHSCKKFIEVQPSSTTIQAENVFEDYATASAALTDIYSQIRDKGVLNGSTFSLPARLGSYTDETDSYQSTSTPAIAFYQNKLLPSSAEVQSSWSISYNQIYAANAVIEGVQNSKNLSDVNKKQLQGEALFIRALIHFYLVNLFGDIPYIVETDYRKNTQVFRMTTQKIYENIILDLQNAAALLPDTYSPTQRVRPNIYTCHALMARAYLYNNQYSEASNEASTLLNQPAMFLLVPDLNNVFLINSKETIWQLQSANAGQNAFEGGFIFTAGPPPTVSLTDNFINSFSAADLRKSKWTKPVTNGTKTWYHAFKYKEFNYTTPSREYSVLFRLSEQYLIRAEARAQQGDLDGARQDLDKIRLRAGLNPTIAQTKAEILNAILKERRWEFFSELGHRFFDLKRFGELDRTLSALKPGWNTEDRLLPIPESELNTNPNLLPQNPGY